MSTIQQKLDELQREINKVAPKSSEKVITISADERRRLEQLLGKNLSSGKELIHMVEKCVSVSTGGITIELKPFLLDRLQTRAIRVPFEQFLSSTVKRLLEEFAGLR